VLFCIVWLNASATKGYPIKATSLTPPPKKGISKMSIISWLFILCFLGSLPFLLLAAATSLALPFLRPSRPACSCCNQPPFECPHTLHGGVGSKKQPCLHTSHSQPSVYAVLDGACCPVPGPGGAAGGCRNSVSCGCCPSSMLSGLSASTPGRGAAAAVVGPTTLPSRPPRPPWLAVRLGGRPGRNVLRSTAAALGPLEGNTAAAGGARASA